MTDLDSRLRLADPVGDPAALDVDDRRLADGVAAILAVAPPTLWTRLRSRTAAVIAGFVAVFVIGTGVAFAAGLPQGVIRAFNDEPAAPGAPVPWNAHDIRLAATLPLDHGRRLQVWTAVNDLNGGTCEDDQVIAPDGRAPDRGHSCQGSYPTGATPGATPTPDPDVFFVHPAMDLGPFQPDTTMEPVFYFGRIYDPAVTHAVLRLPGRPDQPFALDSSGRWGIVQMPSGWAEAPTQVGHAVLFDQAGRIVSSEDLATLDATPDTRYKADGSIAPHQPDGADGPTTQHSFP